jgi:RNA polymerase sigma-70 factor (ECF subfamily)
VLDWQAAEVGELLGITVAAVKSALHRARATLSSAEIPRTGRDATLGILDGAAQDRLERYVHAWETADVDALLRLLTEDATFSMPPIPAWYQGREVIGGLVSKTIFGGPAVGRWRLVPTRANRQIAFGLYRVTDPANAGYHRGESVPREQRGDTPGVYAGYGIQVLTFSGEWIADITTFRDPGLVALFGLPAILTIPTGTQSPAR